jgi:ribokinase
MIKIAVIGIAGQSVFLSVDEFNKIGETATATTFHDELGGKGFNQAVAAAKSGAEVSFLCACYQGDVKEYEKISKEYGVKPFFIAKKERSPYAVIVTDRKGDNSVTVYRGAQLSAEDVENFADEIKSANILLINNEVPQSVNDRAVEIAKEFGVKVILNPAPYRQNPKEFLEKIDLFTPNEHEKKGLEDYKNVIETQGAKGAFIRELNICVPAIKVEKVVDTTGAGDTFNGVLAVSLAEGQDIKSACERANLASAIKVTRKYILKSIPTRKEIAEYEEK